MEKGSQVFMTDPLSTNMVSVIISFLNEERFLAEAVDSVLQQEYENWELILVNDGSSDGSSVIAKNFASAYPDKIIYTEHYTLLNKGLSESRNHGISKAHGELIAILDADDVWSPAKLSLQVEIMKLNPQVAMLCEASEYWYSWDEDKQVRKDEIIQVGTLRDQVFYPPRLVEMLYPLSDGAAPCPSGIIFRKEAFYKIGGFEGHFTGKYQLYEDQAFLSKMYLNEAVYVSSSCNNKYRQRTGSLVQKAVQQGYYKVVRKYFLDWLKQYIEKNNFRNKNIEQLLERALEPYNHTALSFMRRLVNRITNRCRLLFT